MNCNFQTALTLAEFQFAILSASGRSCDFAAALLVSSAMLCSCFVLVCFDFPRVAGDEQLARLAGLLGVGAKPKVDAPGLATSIS